MKKFIYHLLRISGLALTLLPSVFVFTGHISFETHKQLMVYGFLAWFGAMQIRV